MVSLQTFCWESSVAVGGWVVGLLGFGSAGLIWSVLVAILGAVILIWITRLIKKEV